MRILLYLHRLAVGGAERQFVQMAEDLARRGNEVLFATNVGGGRLERELGTDVEHIVLHATRDGGRLRRLSRVLEAPRLLAQLVQERRPAVVYSANYEPNVFAYRALRKGPTPLVWGLRGSDQELPLVGRTAARYGRRLSPRVAGAIFNSKAGRDWHRSVGWAFHESGVVPNGIDTERFRPDPAARHSFREEEGIDPAAFVILLVGRLVEVKDHGLFLRAAARLAAEVPEAIFLCVGGGSEEDRRRVEELAATVGLGERLRLLGDRTDVDRAYAAADVVACTSRSEGFPNVLGEAMATGTPCASMDVGDAAWILGDTGLVTADRRPEATTELWRRFHRLGPIGRRQRGEAARARVSEFFSRAACARTTEAELSRMLQGARERARVSQAETTGSGR